MSVDLEAYYCFRNMCPCILKADRSAPKTKTLDSQHNSSCPVSRTPSAEPLEANWGSYLAQTSLTQPLESREALSFVCNGERKLFIWDLLTPLCLRVVFQLWQSSSPAFCLFWHFWTALLYLRLDSGVFRWHEVKLQKQSRLDFDTNGLICYDFFFFVKPAEGGQ